MFCVSFVLAEKVTLIDFEFTAYNYQAHDIAMHFCDYAGADHAVIFYQYCLLVTLSNVNM